MNISHIRYPLTRPAALVLTSALLCSAHLTVNAQSSFIEKIYHPYVEAGEQEFEFQSIINNDPGTANKYRLSYGRSFTDNWFFEAYIIGEQNNGGRFQISAYELEAKWQISEQGEFWADWGLLISVEKDTVKNNQEIETALLVEKEWGRWVGTANLYAIYEWENNANNELKGALTLQAKYRYTHALEPAIEFYGAKGTRGLGPVLMGNTRLGRHQKIHWEAGIIFGIDSNTPNQTFRGLLEIEY